MSPNHDKYICQNGIYKVELSGSLPKKLVEFNTCTIVVDHNPCCWDSLMRLVSIHTTYPLDYSANVDST